MGLGSPKSWHTLLLSSDSQTPTTKKCLFVFDVVSETIHTQADPKTALVASRTKEKVANNYHSYQFSHTVLILFDCRFDPDRKSVVTFGQKEKPGVLSI